MAAEALKCPRCGEPHFEGTDWCEGCGQALSATAQQPLAPSAAQRALYAPPAITPAGAQVQQAGHPTVVNVREVTVTDVRMPFGSMVVFMIKWAIASVPAGIVLAAIWFGLMFLLTALLGGVGGLLSNSLF